MPTLVIEHSGAERLSDFPCAPQFAARLWNRSGAIWTVANAVALLGVALLFRLWHLDRLPGVNGDEAWYGVAALRWLGGESIGWQTPTGNPINPFFLGPLIALHYCWAPSIVLLRSTAVISGVLACGLNYWLCRRAFDARTALISTILLAILPIDLAYGRFAWDASQSLLFAVIVLYAVAPSSTGAGRRFFNHKLATGMLALIAAIWVHPTNVFAAPLVLVPLAFPQRKALAAWLRRAVTRFSGRMIVASLSIIGVAAVIWPRLLGLAANIAAPARWIAFLIDYMRLLSGATVYRFISGALPDTVELPGLHDLDAFDAVAMLPIALVLYGFARRLADERQPADVCLAWSVGLMLGIFCVVAGPAALQPHFERYGIVLIAPSALLAARGVTWWLSLNDGRARLAGLATVACGWLLVASFWSNYWRFFERTGGESHLTFRTAATEPKAQSLKILQADSAARRPAWVVVDEWWLYWPLRYLAGVDPKLRIIARNELPADSLTPQKLSVQHIWFVQFVSGEAETAANECVRHSGCGMQRRVVKDRQGRPLISLIRAF